MDRKSETRSFDEGDVIDMNDDELAMGLTICDMFSELGNQENGLAGVDTQPHAVKQERIDAQPHFAEQERLRGQVEKFAPKRGFGVIIPEDGSASVFAHWTQICSRDKWPQLTPGMEVMYSLALENGKAVAKEITTLDGGEISSLGEIERETRDLSPFFATGTVTMFHKAGYGFLAIDESANWYGDIFAGSSVYVSRDDLVVADGNVCTLKEGMRVKFRLYKPPGKPVAAAMVVGEDGQPLKSDTQIGMKGKGKLMPTTKLAPKGSKIIPVRKTIQKHENWNSGPRVRKHFGELVEDEFEDEPEPPPGTSDDLTAQMATDILETLTTVSETSDGITEQILETLASVCDQAISQASSVSPFSQHHSSNTAASIPCKFFAEGRCAKGMACTFSHDLDIPNNLQTVNVPKAGAISILCKFFLQGRCLKGDACPYSHATTMANHVQSTDPALSQSGKPLCKFFLKGGCSRGESCFFSHSFASC